MAMFHNEIFLSRHLHHLSASASREDVYSSIERRRQNLNIQEVTYKISGEGKTSEYLGLCW